MDASAPLIAATLIAIAAQGVASAADQPLALVLDKDQKITGLRRGAIVLDWRPDLPALVDVAAVVRKQTLVITHRITPDAHGLTWRQEVTNTGSKPVGIGFAWPVMSTKPAKSWTAPGLPLSMWSLDQDQGVSLIQHPDEAIWTKDRHLAAGASITATALIRVHEADWRPAVAALVKAYPQWMEPTVAAVHRVAGGGAYSNSWEVPPPAHSLAMGFRMNWKASFDFTGLSLYVAPSPVPVTATWTSCRKQTTSIARMQDYAQRMKAAGFHVLNYFNITEAGHRIAWPAPPRKAKDDADLWRDPNDFVHYAIPDAVLRQANGKMLYTNWEGCVITDPGERRYQDHMVDQATRLARDIPAAAGIAIDRMDHLGKTNTNRNDGLTAGKDGTLSGARLLVGWMQAMDRIGPAMHDAGKVIFTNPIGHYSLAAYRHADGIYTEYWREMEACSLLCVVKPLVVWSGPYDDAAMQKLIHHGAWPTCPMPGNDHTQGPDAAKEAMVASYGSIFDALRGRRWALHARPIACDDVPAAKLNLFHIPGGYLATVTAAGTATTATVRLPALPLPAAVSSLKAWSITPAGEWNSVTINRSGNDWTATIPLARGCGFLRLHWAWIEPFQPWWKIRPSIDIATTIDGAIIRATTDGKPPQANTPPWTTPLTPGGSLTLRAGIWKNGQRLGDELCTDFIEAP